MAPPIMGGRIADTSTCLVCLRSEACMGFEALPLVPTVRQHSFIRDPAEGVVGPTKGWIRAAMLFLGVGHTIVRFWRTSYSEDERRGAEYFWESLQLAQKVIQHELPHVREVLHRFEPNKIRRPGLPS